MVPTAHKTARGWRSGLNATTLVILSAGYPLALISYRWLYPTLEGEQRWHMFRLLMLIPVTSAALVSVPSVARLLIGGLF
jgi:hypothetical protein